MDDGNNPVELFQDGRAMRRNEILSTLTIHHSELRQRFGIKSLALFGSVARNEEADTSDVDLLVEFDRSIGLFHLIGTQQYLEKLLGVKKVDLVLRDAIIKELKEGILREAIDVFKAEKEEMEVPNPAYSGSD